MTGWIRIITLATQGTVITLIRSTTQSAKNDLRHTLEPNCNENYRHRISESVLVYSVKRVRTLSGNPEKVLRNWYGANTYTFLEAPNNSSWTNTECQLVIPDSYWLLHILKLSYFNDCFLIPLSMVYAASPETTPRNTQCSIPETIRNTYKLSLASWGYSLAPNVPMKNLKYGSEQAVDKSQQPCKSTITVVRLRVIDFQICERLKCRWQNEE